MNFQTMVTLLACESNDYSDCEKASVARTETNIQKFLAMSFGLL